MRILDVLRLLTLCVLPATLFAALEVPEAAVPEPGTALLLIPALAAFALKRRFRR